MQLNALRAMYGSHATNKQTNNAVEVPRKLDNIWSCDTTKCPQQYKGLFCLCIAAGLLFKNLWLKIEWNIIIWKTVNDAIGDRKMKLEAGDLGSIWNGSQCLTPEAQWPFPASEFSTCHKILNEHVRFWKGSLTPHWLVCGSNWIFSYNQAQYI